MTHTHKKKGGRALEKKKTEKIMLKKKFGQQIHRTNAAKMQ